jgi:hypothetical protein
VGTRLIKQNTLSCEFMRELHVCESALEAELQAVQFALRMAEKSNETVVGIETISLALMKALLFAQQPLVDPTCRVLKGSVLDYAADMDWVGLRWIPEVANTAREVSSVLGQPRGDPEHMR